MSSFQVKFSAALLASTALASLGAASAQVGVFLQSLADYPPRQKSLDFDIDAMMAALYGKSAR